MRIILLMLLGAFIGAALQHCQDQSAYENVRVQPRTARACVEAFYTTWDAWQDAEGPLKEACGNLESDYRVQLVDHASSPCTNDRGEVFPACSDLAAQVIYIGIWREDPSRVALAVHEWLHILAKCELGDKDSEHRIKGLWLASGDSSVESVALSRAAAGPCL